MKSNIYYNCNFKSGNRGKLKTLLFLFLIGSTSFIYGQTTLNVRVNNGLDDHEERISGSVSQTGTLGNMDAASDDLELGNEQPTADPQLVGIRFTNITIPKFATIVSAYIQFAVDGTGKNTDPSSLSVRAEDNANPAAFSNNPFSLSTRTLAAGSISWNVSWSTWSTVASAGVDQRTPELKSLLQPLVFKSTWVSGNAMTFFIKGSGTHEVESFEGDPLLAPELVVTYSVAGSGTTSISEWDRASTVTVYPNPFKNEFNLNVEVYTPSDLSISVYDLMGKLLEEKNVPQAGTGTFSYTSSADLIPGMYFVKIKANGREEVVKIISE